MPQNTIELTTKYILKSDLSSLREVEDIVESIANTLSIDREKKILIKIALSEAVSNAIIHGNKNNPAKKVFLRYKLEKNNSIKYIYFEVEDEGEGFEYTEFITKKIKDIDPQSEKRGIIIMRSIANELCYRNKGKCVCLKFTV